jgi:hypothetical protein
MAHQVRAAGLRSLLVGWAVVLGYCLAVAAGPHILTASGGKPAASFQVVLIASASD